MDNPLRNNGKRGGGLAIIYKDSLEIKKIEEKHANTYQSAKWKTSVKNTHIYILGIYRPPQSNAATPISNFTEEFLEDIQDDVIQCAILVILGGFNIHINDQNDNEAQSFIDCLAAAGLQQHVENYTHRLDNTLDHIYTLAGNALTVRECRTGPFVSDHCLVKGTINILRNEIERRTVTMRNYRNFELDKFRKDLKFSMDGKRLPALCELAEMYRSVASECMDKHSWLRCRDQLHLNVWTNIAG